MQQVEVRWLCNESEYLWFDVGNSCGSSKSNLNAIS